MNSEAPKRHLRALSIPFILVDATALYWIFTNFMLGNHFRNFIWVTLILIPSTLQLYRQYKFQNAILYKMSLKDNGREVVLHTIFGGALQIPISDIIKGEYYVHANSEYYQFTVKGDYPTEFFIDYPEKMKYPKTLKYILSGNAIVTHKFNPDIDTSNPFLSYKDKLEYVQNRDEYEKKKAEKLAEIDNLIESHERKAIEDKKQ